MNLEQFLDLFALIIERYLFSIQLIIACGLYCFWLPKRKNFALRIVCGLLVIFALASVWNPAREYPFYLYLVQYITAFIVILCVIYSAYRVSVLTVLFCGTGGYIVQHLAYRINMLVSYGYESVFEDNPVLGYVLYAACGIVVYVAVYVAVYKLLASKLKMSDEVCAKNKNIIYVSLATVLCVVVLSLGFDSTTKSLPLNYRLITVLYLIVICTFLMFMLYSVFKSNRLENEADLLEQMMRMKEEQYAVTQSTIDIINIKCHDMKHQLALLQGKLNKEDISELQKSISIYDTAVKTGNPALDIVLAEKGLLCQQYNIRFTCIAEGEGLNFMRDSDIYSLFANALDNAVTAVRNIADENKRVITISVKKSINMMLIHIENYYEEELVFDRGLPVTTKADKNYHGFGLKSIKTTVEKYGGFMSVSAQDNIFKLNISISVP